MNPNINVKVLRHLSNTAQVVMLIGKVILTMRRGDIKPTTWMYIRAGVDVNIRDLMPHGHRTTILGTVAPTPDELDILASKRLPGAKPLTLIWDHGYVLAEMDDEQEPVTFVDGTLHQVLTSDLMQSHGRVPMDLSWI